MKTAIGTEVIEFEPMPLGTYNKVKGWNTPANEDPNREGYLVKYSDDYFSWSPKEAFDAAYREIDNGTMDFGMAVHFAKLGKKVARIGWNGAGMYALIMPGYPEGIRVDEATQKAHGVPDGTVMKFRPYWVLKTAQDDVATWAPSGSDSLAEDWIVVE